VVVANPLPTLMRIVKECWGFIGKSV